MSWVSRACDAGVRGGGGLPWPRRAAGGRRARLLRLASLASAATAFGGASALLVGVGLRGDVEGLGALGVVAVDGYGLEALAPGLDVGFGDVVDGAVLREVDGLGDGSGEEGLGGGHHLDVAHVVRCCGFPWRA